MKISINSKTKSNCRVFHYVPNRYHSHLNEKKNEEPVIDYLLITCPKVFDYRTNMSVID